MEEDLTESQFLFKNRKRLGNLESIPDTSTHPAIRCALEKLQNFLAISPHPNNRNLLPTPSANMHSTSDIRPATDTHKFRNRPGTTPTNQPSDDQATAPRSEPHFPTISEPQSRNAYNTPGTNAATEHTNEPNVDSQDTFQDISGMEEDLTESQFITVEEIGFDDENEENPIEPISKTMQDNPGANNNSTVEHVGLHDNNEVNPTESVSEAIQDNQSAHKDPERCTDTQHLRDPERNNGRPTPGNRTANTRDTNPATPVQATSPDGTQSGPPGHTETQDPQLQNIHNSSTDHTNAVLEPPTDSNRNHNKETTAKTTRRQERSPKTKTPTKKSTHGRMQCTTLTTRPHLSPSQDQTCSANTTIQLQNITETKRKASNEKLTPPGIIPSTGTAEGGYSLLLPKGSRKRKATAEATSLTEPDRSHITQLLQTAIVNRTPPRPQRDPRNTRAYRARHGPNPTWTSATDKAPDTSITKHIPVKGEESILSNFALTPIHTCNNRFASAEHMYQHMKARFFRQPQLAKQILKQPRAIQAKTAAYTLMHPPRHKQSALTQRLIQRWDSIRLAILYQVMRIKFDNVPEAAEALKATHPALLYHPVSDRFWGTGSTDRSRTSTPNGNDHFANLLMIIRADLTTTSPPDSTQLTSRLVDTHQRHIADLLPQDQQKGNNISNITDLIKPTEEMVQPKQPTPAANQDAMHNLTPETLDRKGTLHLELEDTPTIILSDSQLRQVTGAQHDKPAALLVFPGAKYESIQALLSRHPPQITVKEVIVAVGINNRDQDPHQTSLKRFTRMIKSCKIVFPNATIYTPEIAHHPTQQETSHITTLQSTILAWLSTNDSHLAKRVSWLNLPDTELEFKGDGIHLTTASATTVTNHWLAQIRQNRD